MFLKLVTKNRFHTFSGFVKLYAQGERQEIIDDKPFDILRDCAAVSYEGYVDYSFKNDNTSRQIYNVAVGGYLLRDARSQVFMKDACLKGKTEYSMVSFNFLPRSNINGIPIMMNSTCTCDEDDKPILPLKSEKYVTLDFDKKKADKICKNDFVTKFYVPTAQEEDELTQNFDSKLARINNYFEEKVDHPVLYAVKEEFKSKIRAVEEDFLKPRIIEFDIFI